MGRWEPPPPRPERWTEPHQNMSRQESTIRMYEVAGILAMWPAHPKYATQHCRANGMILSCFKAVFNFKSTRIFKSCQVSPSALFLQSICRSRLRSQVPILAAMRPLSVHPPALKMKARQMTSTNLRNRSARGIRPLQHWEQTWDQLAKILDALWVMVHLVLPVLSTRVPRISRYAHEVITNVPLSLTHWS